jgi:hypothetical protein
MHQRRRSKTAGNGDGGGGGGKKYWGFGIWSNAELRSK